MTEELATIKVELQLNRLKLEICRLILEIDASKKKEIVKLLFKIIE